MFLHGPCKDLSPARKNNAKLSAKVRKVCGVEKTDYRKARCPQTPPEEKSSGKRVFKFIYISEKTQKQNKAVTFSFTSA